MNSYFPWLWVLIISSLVLWITCGQCLIYSENVAVFTKEEKTVGLLFVISLFVIIIWVGSFTISPVMAYLEMQLLSFSFKKFKSRMTIDEEDDQYRSLQQTEIVDFV